MYIAQFLSNFNLAIKLEKNTKFYYSDLLSLWHLYQIPYKNIMITSLFKAQYFICFDFLHRWVHFYLIIEWLHCASTAMSNIGCLFANGAEYVEVSTTSFSWPKLSSTHLESSDAITNKTSVVSVWYFPLKKFIDSSTYFFDTSSPSWRQDSHFL